MAPGKGVFLILNDEYLQFLRSATMDVQQCYNDELHDNDPKSVIMALTSGDENLQLELNWTYEKDNFGVKAYTSTPYKKGELRVTVVLTKQSELRLDVREWFEPTS